MERCNPDERICSTNEGSDCVARRFCKMCGAGLDESGACPNCTLKSDSSDDKGLTREDEGRSARRFCRKCGSPVNGDGVCPECGTRLGVELVDDKPKREEKVVDESKSRRCAIAVSLGSAAVLMCAIIGVISYGVNTALHWEKVDNPGRWVEQSTGYYNVMMDEVNPCYVGQDWTDCINAYIAEYNRECTKPMPPVDGSSRFGSSHDREGKSYRQADYTKINPTNQRLCERYSEMISGMQAKDGPGYYVSSLGSWGHLYSTPDTKRVLVGFESHEAVCYLGFLGECPEEDEGE